MTLRRLLGLQDAIRECSSGLAECSPPPLGILGAIAAGDVRPLEFVPIAKRDLDSHTKRVIILSTVLGTVGTVALILGIFFLLWNNGRRQRARAENAMADSLDVEYPSRSFYDARSKQPTYEAYPPVPPKPSAYTPRRITNHPYASQYVEDADIPDSAVAPPLPVKESTRMKAAAAAHPVRSPQPQPSPAVTVAIASSHPYRTPSPSDQEDSPRQPKPPTKNNNRNKPATSVVYESFMSALEPSPPQTPEPGSPIIGPSSPGTSTSDSMGRRKRQTTFSDVTAETSMSVTSSTPLQPRPSLRQNRR